MGFDLEELGGGKNGDSDQKFSIWGWTFRAGTTCFFSCTGAGSNPYPHMPFTAPMLSRVHAGYASGTSLFPLPEITIGEMADSIAAKYPGYGAVVSAHLDILILPIYSFSSSGNCVYSVEKNTKNPYARRDVRLVMFKVSGVCCPLFRKNCAQHPQTVPDNQHVSPQ